MKTVKIIHLGIDGTQRVLYEDVYQDVEQFIALTKAIHGCKVLEKEFSIDNGRGFSRYIPYCWLKDCLVSCDIEEITLAEYAIQKSKMEV